MAQSAPPPPSYTAATAPGYPQQPPSDVPPVRVYGGSQYTGLQPDSGLPNQGYHDGNKSGGYPTPGGYYNQAQAPPPATESQHINANPDTDDSEAQFTGNSFTDKAIRRSFIRKVYMILMSQLAVTVGIICFFVFHEPTNTWIRYQGGKYFYYCSYAVFIVTYIVLVCCPTVRRKTPGNYICLAIFTLAFSLLAATISSFHRTNIVLIAIGITAAVCLAISIFACQTKWDFTLCSGLLFAALMVLFFFGWACVIVYLVSGPNQILSCVYAALGALVFAMFLAYDTQKLLGGRQYELEPEEYIFGALQLYMDIVYIFLFITSLAGNSSS